jgi:hypothetical protein
MDPFGATTVLNSFQSELIILATVGGTAAFLLLLQFVWPSEVRRPHNELIGWNVTILGTIYAVIIGFMLFAVWTDYEAAEANVEAEANSLVNVARLARGLPTEQRAEVANLARDYVNVMLTKEWAAMNRGELTPESHAIIRELWHTLAVTETHSGLEQTGLDHTLAELTKMTAYRRQRALQMKAELPEILWIVLIAGAVVTIGSACLFGAAKFRVHLTQVGMLALMISSVLVAIADLRAPFQGAAHIEAACFERARLTFLDMP